jgi:hypothetical protein
VLGISRACVLCSRDKDGETYEYADDEFASALESEAGTPPEVAEMLATCRWELDKEQLAATRAATRAATGKALAANSEPSLGATSEVVAETGELDAATREAGAVQAAARTDAAATHLQQAREGDAQTLQPQPQEQPVKSAWTGACVYYVCVCVCVCVFMRTTSIYRLNPFPNLNLHPDPTL